MLRVLTIAETALGSTYTGHMSVPAGARLLNVLIETTHAWTAATAPVDVGDSDAADALVAAFDLAPQGGRDATQAGGTDWGNGLAAVNGVLGAAGGPGKLYPNGDIITAVVSPTVPGGPTGVSVITFWIELLGVPRVALVV